MAVLRYRLYDVDVVISRTLLVAGLVGFITAAYVGIVVGVGSLVGGDGNPNVVLSVVATTVVAVAFQPVRRWLQRVANRVVFGRRSTPYDVLRGLRPGWGLVSRRRSRWCMWPSCWRMARVPTQRGCGCGWARAPCGSRVAAFGCGGRQGDDRCVGGMTVAVSQLPQADLAVPVVDRGELLGVLTIAKPRGERVSEVDTDLVERLAAASGVVLRNLRLDASWANGWWTWRRRGAGWCRRRTMRGVGSSLIWRAGHRPS